MKKLVVLYKKLHKWPGLVLSFILLYYGITGILLNHRNTFAPIDINRRFLPENYTYRNWNNAAIKGNLIINPDSILVYGNIGIWLTDSSYSRYSSFNAGFAQGSDHRKIFDLYKDTHGNLYAATLFGLYAFDKGIFQWKRLETGDEKGRFTGIDGYGDTIFVMSRSFLFKGKAAGTSTQFLKIQLPAPEGSDNKVSLFLTIWQIHSGEIFGMPGKLFVDMMGLITVFLSVTGMIYFFIPGWIRRRNNKNKPVTKIAFVSRWSLRWHNLTGAWTFIFLILLFFTGIFLRPPLLLAIAQANIKPLKFSHLDQPNFWYDKLRDVLYDARNDRFMLSTSEGMYAVSKYDLKPQRFVNQPPVSVMGISVFQTAENGTFLIGSFSGLFLWHPDHPDVYNYLSGEVYQNTGLGRPVGDYKITGILSTLSDLSFLVDYDQGVLSFQSKSTFPEMPQNILSESGMSLWNVCLEIHTGRFFQNLLGDFYILIVPLAGLAGIVVAISGYLLWRKKFRKQAKQAVLPIY